MIDPQAEPQGARAEAATAEVWSLVLNWNRRDLCLECLASLRRTEVPADVRHRVLLIDNGSTDDSVAAVREAMPDVLIEALPENLGFAAGMNAGIRRALAAGADWTLLVNNDATVEPATLGELWAGSVVHAGRPAAHAAEPIGLVAPTIYVYGTDAQIWPSAGRRRAVTLAPIDTTAKPPSTVAYDVEWANGCCVLVAAACWRSVGLFDERLRFYYEDHDLCLRVRAAGWRLQHVPAAVAHHRVAASTGEGTPRQRYLLARGSVPYFLAHTRGLHRCLIVPYRVASAVRTMAGRLVRGDLAGLRATARGLADGWADWRRDWRRDVNASRVRAATTDLVGR